MLSTMFWFESSTSPIASLTIRMFSPNCMESVVMELTLLSTIITFSKLVATSCNVSVMDFVILSLVCSNFCSALRILPEDTCVSSLSLRISSATTAKPFPASPALAASIDAFNASKLVWLLISSIVPVSSFTIVNSVLNSFRFSSTSLDRFAIALVH